MNSSTIAVRYAKAIFMLAKEKDLLKEVNDDFILIKKALLPLPEFKTFITSPIVKPDDKKNVFTKNFEKIINKLSLDFLNFLVDKHREGYLMDIIRHYEFLYRKEFNIKEVIVTTTEPLSPEAEEKICQLVYKAYGCNGVEINNHINEQMIGGVIIRIDNLQLDLSVKTQLEEIKQTLKSESYKIGI